MSITEDETSLDMDWIASLEEKVSDAKSRDENRVPTIYRVPDILKMVDPKAYEPLLVSLGPYHCDKPHLQAMNQLKWKYLTFVLEQNRDVTLVKYLDRIKRLETRALDAYLEKVKMSSNSFLEMMLLDGCFVMLTIMEWNIVTKSIWCAQEWLTRVEGNFKTKISGLSNLWTRSVVVRDIFILENQLPFFLLETLYESAFPHGPPFRNLTFQFIRMHTSINLELPPDNETFHHIIHVFLSCIDPTRNYDCNPSRGLSLFPILGVRFRFNPYKLLLQLLIRTLSPQLNKIFNVRKAKTEDDLQVLEFPWIPPATVLNTAGIYFERKKRAKSFLDITFHKGKLQMPKLQIDENTNALLRNLIAYEQCSMGPNFHVSSYAKLMDYIVNTAEDVELLKKEEIIVSDLGDNKVLATLFNKLPMYIVVQWRDTYFFDGINALLKQRNTRCSKWRAVLNREYFGNPWTVFSLFGALVLFALTVTQTIYAVLSYARSPK